MKLIRPCLALVLAFALATPTFAHFLWINKVTGEGGKTTVQLCFGEEAEPGEAEFVDRVAKAQFWQQSGSDKPALTKLEKEVAGDVGCFSGAVDNGAGLAAALDYGVISRGEKTFVLQYYAKHLDLARADEVKQFGRTEQLRLDVVPAISGEECTLTVLFEGKPAPAGSQVMVGVPGQKQQELKTDDQGRVKFTLGSEGKHEIRARVQHDKPGERDGKAYTHEMHYVTLVLTR
jgi:uncharacterized GH25 family protein